MGRVIRMQGVHKTYIGREERLSVQALRDVSLGIDANEIVCIIGPSGCGKTTLLKLLAGLLDADKGEIFVQDRRVVGPMPECAMVFQDFALLPWATVTQNITFGLELRGVQRTVYEAAAADLIVRMGLTGFHNHYPRELSGGMQQRVGLARALAVEPEILLMDEPFGSLDAQTRRVLQDDLLHVFEETPLTVVLVTHSIEEAVLLADRVVLMGRAPGTVIDTLSVPLPRPRPENVDHLPGFYETRAYLWQQLRALQ